MYTVEKHPRRSDVTVWRIGRVPAEGDTEIWLIYLKSQEKNKQNTEFGAEVYEEKPRNTRVKMKIKRLYNIVK